MKKVSLIGLMAMVAGAVLATEIKPLTVEESIAAGGATHVAIVKYTDFATETNTNTGHTVTQSFVNVGAKMGAEVVKLVLKVPFENSVDSTNAITSLSIGDGTDSDRFLTATELNVNGTEVYVKYGRNLVAGTYESVSNTVGTIVYAATADVTTGIGKKLYTTADTIDFFWTHSVAKALSALDKGEVWVYLQLTK